MKRKIHDKYKNNDITKIYHYYIGINDIIYQNCHKYKEIYENVYT